MLVAFRFTYCTVGSWDGKWTGASYNYQIVRSYTLKEFNGIDAFKKGLPGSWTFNHGDGWTALITAKIVDAKEAIQIRKKSDGFAGKEWMLNSLIKYGKIMTDRQIKELEIQPE